MLYAIFAFLSIQSEALFASDIEDSFAKHYEQAKKIAQSQKIVEDAGHDFSYIDGSVETGVSIIHNVGIASRTKYEIITPIINIISDSIYVDCSYIVSFDVPTSAISVGGYCRGESKATPDMLDYDKVAQNRITYSSSASWLKNVEKMIECKSPSGLIYSGIYFVRCQDGKYDGSTGNNTIIAFSSGFDKLFAIHGYELAPIMPAKKAGKLIFWKLNKEISYEIIQIKLSTIGNSATYKPEKVLYSISIDEGKPAIVKQKNYLYDKPNLSDKTNKYLIVGDKVTVDKHEADFCRVSYLGGKKPLQMWMLCDSLEVDAGKQ
jgi:hypothetical protein